MASGSGEPTLLDCIAMEEALNEGDEEVEEVGKPATTAKLKSNAQPQRQSDVDDIFSDVGTNDTAHRNEKRKRLKERQDVSDALSTASSTRRKKGSDAAYGPADAMAMTKAGKAAAEEDAQVRAERAAEAEDAHKKKRKARAPEPQPKKLPKEEEEAINKEFTDAGGLVFPLSPSFPDRSDKAALRLASLIGSGSMTSDIDWVGNTKANTQLQPAIRAFSDNALFAHVILKRDIRTAVFKRADGTEFESQTSNYKYCDTLRQKLRDVVSECHKIQDHTAQWGPTHLDAARIEDVCDLMFDSLTKAGRLTTQFVHKMTAADVIGSKDDVKLQLFKFQWHDISLEDARAIAACPVVQKAGFYLWDFDVTQDLQGVVRESDLIEWGKSEMGWAFGQPTSASTLSESLGFGPSRALIVDNGHTTGRNSFTVFQHIPLHGSLPDPKAWGRSSFYSGHCVDSDTESDTAYGSDIDTVDKDSQDTVLVRTKFYLVNACRIEKASVKATSGTNMYALITSRFNRFSEGSQVTEKTGRTREEITYALYLLGDIVNSYKFMPEVDKMETDLDVYRRLIPEEHVYFMPHKQTAEEYLKSRVNAVVAIDTHYDCAQVVHSVAAATGAICSEPVLQQASKKSHHILGLMPSAPIVDIVAVVRGQPFSRTRSIRSDKQKLSQVEKDASDRLHAMKEKEKRRKQYHEHTRRALQDAGHKRSKDEPGQKSLTDDFAVEESAKARTKRKEKEAAEEEAAAEEVDPRVAAQEEEAAAVDISNDPDDAEELAAEDKEEDDNDGVALGPDGKPLAQEEEEETEEADAPDVTPNRADVAKEIMDQIMKYKVAPGFIGIITLRYLRANRHDPSVAAMTYLTNPRGSRLFSAQEEEKGIPAGFNVNGTLVGDPVGSLPEHNTREGVMRWLLEHSGFAPSDKINFFLDHGSKNVRKNAQMHFQMEHVALKLSENPYILTDKHVRALIARNVTSGGKVAKVSAKAVAADKDLAEDNKESDVQLDVDRSRGIKTKANARFLENKIVAQAMNVSDSITDALAEEVQGFKEAAAAESDAYALHRKLQAKGSSIGSIALGKHQVVALRFVPRHKSFLINTSVLNDSGLHPAFNITAHVAAGINANMEKIASLESPLMFESFSGSKRIHSRLFHIPGALDPFAEFNVTETRGGKHPQVKGTLTLADGAVLWDSSVSIRTYIPEAVSEAASTAADQALLQKPRVERVAQEVAVALGPDTISMVPGSKHGLATTDAQKEIVQHAANRWGPPPEGMEALLLTDADLVRVKRMSVSVMLQAQSHRSRYLRFLGRTAYPVSYKSQVGHVSRWQLLGSDPNVDQPAGEPFLCWTDACIKVVGKKEDPGNGDLATLMKEMKTARTPGVGWTLFEQKELLVPGAVFHLKAHAHGKYGIPWGIVYPADDWANHFDYHLLPTIVKGKKANEGGADTLDVVDIGVACVYPTDNRGGSAVEAKEFLVLKAADGKMYRLAQPGNSPIKKKLRPGCKFNTVAWSVEA